MQLSLAAPFIPLNASWSPGDVTGPPAQVACLQPGSNAGAAPAPSPAAAQADQPLVVGLLQSVQVRQPVMFAVLLRDQYGAYKARCA